MVNSESLMQRSTVTMSRSILDQARAALDVQGPMLSFDEMQATVLLAKDPSAGSSKLDAARALGTRILTETQFRKQHGI